MKRICKQCGKEFVLTQDEIAFYQSKNLQIPKRCAECRRKNKEGGRKKERMQPAAQGKNRVEKEAAGGAKTGNETIGGELSGNGYENTARSDQVVRAYHGRESGRKKSWTAAAAVLILLAVVILGFRTGFLSGQDGGTAQEQTVKTFTAEVPKAAEAEDSGNTSEAAEAEDSGNTSEAAETEDSENTSEAAETEDSENKPKAAEAENLENASDESEIESGTDLSQDAVPAVTYTYYFRKTEYLQEHFDKHGAEFGYASAEEYLAGANRVIASPDVLHKLEAEDGDDVYYLESTNEFVIVSTDGFLRTYFKPEDGKAYFDRQ